MQKYLSTVGVNVIQLTVIERPAFLHKIQARYLSVTGDLHNPESLRMDHARLQLRYR